MLETLEILLCIMHHHGNLRTGKCDLKEGETKAWTSRNRT